MYILCTVLHQENVHTLPKHMFISFISSFTELFFSFLSHWIKLAMLFITISGNDLLTEEFFAWLVWCELIVQCSWMHTVFLLILAFQLFKSSCTFLLSLSAVLFSGLESCSIIAFNRQKTVHGLFLETEPKTFAQANRLSADSYIITCRNLTGCKAFETSPDILI